MKDKKLVQKSLIVLKKLRLVFLSLLLLVGVVLVYSYVHIKHAQERGLASVGGAFGETNNQKIKIIQSTFVELIDGEWFINVGAFGENACERYPYLQITLRAVGVAAQGDVPEIKVRQNCVLNLGSEVFTPVIVPMAQLTSLEADDLDFADDDGRQIRALNGAGFWPDEWYVHEILFTSADDKDIFSVDAYEISHVLGHNFVIQF